MERYSVTCYGGMERDPSGPWVRYDDIQGDSDETDPTPDPAE